MVLIYYFQGVIRSFKEVLGADKVNKVLNKSATYLRSIFKLCSLVKIDFKTLKYNDNITRYLYIYLKEFEGGFSQVHVSCILFWETVLHM